MSKRLRGHSNRKARRQIKNGTAPVINIGVMNVYSGPGADPRDLTLSGGGLTCTDDRDVITAESAGPECHVCKAIGDDPCVTKTGNKAKTRHAGRDIL